MSTPTREAWIGAMTKHLPPSGLALRLLDIDGASGATLLKARPDLEIHAVESSLTEGDVAPDSRDALVLYDQALTPALLETGLRSLRPGGRLIAVLPSEQVDERWVTLLERHGYIRILLEPALVEAASGVLVRGEKPHTTADTLERIRIASTRDDALTDLARYPGHFVYLLVRQMPNKPVWALREGESVTWNAVFVPTHGQAALITFSSLAKAVAFMQPAILAGHIRDINKVAKYRVETIRAWDIGVILNPADGFLAGSAYTLRSIDPAQAEAPDE